MYPIEEFIEEVKKAAGTPGFKTAILVPPEGKGDLAVACFGAAKEFGKKPNDLAKDMEKRIMDGERVWIKECRAEGGYLNFFIDCEMLAKKTFDLIGEGNYGKGEEKSENILLEHTSANPTGPLHTGRGRNPIIGDTMARMLRFCGYSVKTEYYVDDAGMQIAILAWGVTNLSHGNEKKWDHRLVECYREADRLRKVDERVNGEIQELLRSYERGEKDAITLFENAYTGVLDGLKETLKNLNIEMDSFVNESEFLRNGDVNRVVEKLGPYTEERDGALCIDLKNYGINDLLFLTRKDGTTLYATRDIAYHLNKLNRCDIAINVLGEDHKLESREISIVLRILGSEKIPNVIFYSFVSLPEGRMSTRKGRVVYLDDLIDESVERAREEVKKRRKDLNENEIERIALAVGTGAVRYNIIKVQPQKPIKFRWEEALNFDGNSAPFLQYAHARASSILRKSGDVRVDNLTFDGEERKLLLRIARFPSAINSYSEQRNPHMVAEYLFDMCSVFNSFYNSCPVLNAPEGDKGKRLMLVASFAEVIKEGCGLLGIEAPEMM